MKISDFKGLFKNNSIEFISKENPEGEYFIFNFKVPAGLTWTTGEHGIFTFSNKKIKGKKFRAFSIASAPEERIIKIATRISKTPSDFKKQLLALNPGDSVKLRGPFGWFKLPAQKSRLLFLAGGIGIAPIRALYREMKRFEGRYQAKLLYVSSDTHLFKNELENWNNSSEFPDSREVFFRKIDEQLKQMHKDDYFYIAGNPRMIKDVSKFLRNNDVKCKQIIKDPFIGY